MTTNTKALNGAASAHNALHAALEHLTRPLGHLLAHYRQAAEERRLRETLAELSDASLRDIGIAEDEIFRVRNRERFTPRAWRDARGLERCCGA